MACVEVGDLQVPIPDVLSRESSLVGVERAWRSGIVFSLSLDQGAAPKLCFWSHSPTDLRVTLAVALDLGGGASPAEASSSVTSTGADSVGALVVVGVVVTAALSLSFWEACSLI
mmetsp:Transcript_117965/g.203866  ORF Transcript_117965/g.203866 Transcript_117965/m.203866 type:complete len:115 (-) Transcript_117965:2813-3157(-)